MQHIKIIINLYQTRPKVMKIKTPLGRGILTRFQKRRYESSEVCDLDSFHKNN